MEAWTQLTEYIDQGGFVMWPLLISAALLWFGIGYRVVFVRRGTRRGVRELVTRATKTYSGPTRGYLDEAVRRAIYVVRNHEGDIPRFLDDELFPLEADLGRYRTLVRTVVIISPLLGLLGTVNGMIEMFSSLGTQTFYSQSGGVAQGISQALFTTQLGLVIAIPGMLVGGLIDRKERRIRDDLHQLKELLAAGNAFEDGGKAV